jgi:hypothetical protein
MSDKDKSIVTAALLAVSSLNEVCRHHFEPREPSVTERIQPGFTQYDDFAAI